MALPELGKYYKYAHLANLRDEQKRDGAILETIDLFPQRIQPNVLRLGGSKFLRAKYLESQKLNEIQNINKILDKQISRGRITPAKAEVLENSVRADKNNLLIKDVVMGVVVCGAIEKVIALAGGVTAYAAGYASLEVSFGAALGFVTANPCAVPYFMWRSGQELSHLKQKLDNEKVPFIPKYTKLAMTSAEVSAATAMNLLPFPLSGIAVISAPLLTRERYSEITNIKLNYHLDNIMDSIRKRRASLVRAIG